MSLTQVVKQLSKTRRELQNQLTGIDSVLRILGGSSSRTKQSKRQLSPEARKRMSITQKQRWAKWRKQNGIKLVKKAA